MEALAENTEQETAVILPLPGQPWPAQGGIYAGSYVKDGQLHHGIFAAGVDSDVQTSFDTLDGKVKDLPQIAGFSDWRAPDQREVMLSFIANPDDFNRKGYDSIYLTSTPFGSYFAWVLGFEGGNVVVYARSSEFRFRPFRSFVA